MSPRKHYNVKLSIQYAQDRRQPALDLKNENEITRSHDQCIAFCYCSLLKIETDQNREVWQTYTDLTIPAAYYIKSFTVFTKMLDCFTNSFKNVIYVSEVGIKCFCNLAPLGYLSIFGRIQISLHNSEEFLQSNLLQRQFENSAKLLELRSYYNCFGGNM